MLFISKYVPTVGAVFRVAAVFGALKIIFSDYFLA